MGYRLETHIRPSGRVYQDYVFFGDPAPQPFDSPESLWNNQPDYQPVIEGALIGAAIGVAIGNFIDSYRAARKARKS